MDYKRISTTQWQWQANDKHYGVRLFAETGTLIWSSWVETGGAPQFEPGTSQVFESFIATAAPEGYRPPPEMVKEVVKEVVALRDKSKKKRNLKDWLK